MRLSHSLDPEKKPVVVPDVEINCTRGETGKRRKRLRKRQPRSPAAKKTAKPAKKKGKGISDVNPSLSDYPAGRSSRKRPGVKETQHTVVFEVSAGATKTQIKEAVQQIFKVKVAGVRTANFVGKMRAAARTKAIGAIGKRRTSSSPKAKR